MLVKVQNSISLPLGSAFNVLLHIFKPMSSIQTPAHSNIVPYSQMFISVWNILQSMLAALQSAHFSKQKWPHFMSTRVLDKL